MTRQLVNPVTSDVTYSDEEREFMLAMDAYKRANNRTYPTWQEVLAVIHSLGYRKVEERVSLPVYKRGSRNR